MFSALGRKSAKMKKIMKFTIFAKFQENPTFSRKCDFLRKSAKSADFLKKSNELLWFWGPPEGVARNSEVSLARVAFCVLEMQN